MNFDDRYVIDISTCLFIYRLTSVDLVAHMSVFINFTIVTLIYPYIRFFLFTNSWYINVNYR